MKIILKRKALRILCRVAIGMLSIALVYGTAAPLIRTDVWWIRIFDFPRIQIAVLIVLTLAAYLILRLFGRLRLWEYTLITLLGFSLVWQLILITPYTAIYPREMVDSQTEDDTNRISLLVYNVLTENRKVEALLELISDNDPDLILLSEPDEWWLNQLKSLDEEYPYTLHQPQENQYGMLLYSRLELIDPEIRFLIEPEIPSFRLKVRLRSETLVTLYGMHPRPPGLKRSNDDESADDNTTEMAVNGNGEDDTEEGEREDSDNRDAELMLVAKEIEKYGDEPVIVAGDFNDVAWSYTTHLFQRIGGLLDPRVGRGLFTTYSTKSRLMRYPLDHVFASNHFVLVELRRLPDIGSDHFPLLVVLDFDPNASEANDEPKPDADDKEEANEAIEKVQ
ncbi:MAG TPA: endonuclease [Bacteroidetes bacterium]|nr:endonuclease [Bacteroidota bacterium]